MLPLATPASLRQYVLDANGDYQTALQKAIGLSGGSSSSSDSSSIYSYFPSDSPAPLPSNGSLSDDQLRVLRAKYAKQAAAARLVLGDAVEEQTILQTFDTHGGDAKKAMSELLGRSSGELRRSLQFSDALRLSSSGGIAATNNGASAIDNFRKSMNLDVLGATEDTEFDFSAITTAEPKREERNEEAKADNLKSSKEKERELKRQQALAKKKEREAARAKSDDQRAMESLDSAMSTYKQEDSETRKAQLNLTPWPVNLLPPADTSLANLVPEEPVKKVVPKILDKSELGAEEKHDADALHAFLRRRHEPSAAISAASEAVKRISPDEFVVVSRQVRKLRLLHTSRYRAIIDAGINGKPQDTLAAVSARKAKERVIEESKAGTHAASLIPSGANVLSTPIDSPAIMSSMNLSSVLSAQREKGLISSLDQSIELCQQAQLDELAQLEAILTSERCRIAECNPRVVSFSLSEPSYINPHDPSGEPMVFQNPLMLQLVAILPATYPELSPPLICVRTSSPHCPIGNFEALEQHLRDEAASLVPIPSLFMIQQSAETWLLESEEMKQIAQSLFVQKATALPGPNDIRQSVQVEHQSSYGSSSGHLSAPALYEGLRALFNESVAEFDFQFHRFEDLLFHRNKQLEKAAAFIIKCYDVIGSEHPVVVEKRKLHPRLEFPVLNLTGDVDYTASLGVVYLNHAKLRQLLDAYDWNLQKMSAAFLESLSSVETYVAFLTSHGLTVNTESTTSTESGDGSSSLETETECPICFCDFARHQGFSLSCGHYACIDCYCEYANVHVSSGSASTLTCTACKIPFDPLSLCALLTTKRWATFCNSVVSQHVSRTDALKWCPSSKPCDYILQIGHMSPDGESESAPSNANLEAAASDASSSSSSAPTSQDPVLVQCKCNHMYCSKCKTVGGHLPMTCEEQARWHRLFPDDMKGGALDQEAEEATKRMLAQITRACPRCGVHISKSGGCPHMSCMSCNHQFCWVCFANWESKHYACNQASVGGHTNVEVSTGTVVPGSASLLFKHRNASYDVGITVLANCLVAPMYAMDDRIEVEIANERINQGLSPTADGRAVAAPKLQDRVIYGQIRKGRSQGPPVYGDRDVGLTFSDVEAFINAAELLQLAHYITTNIIKFVIMINARDIINVSRNSPTYHAINRVISDLISISELFKQSHYSKSLLWHVQSCEKSLRISLKLLLEHVQYIRDNYDVAM